MLLSIQIHRQLIIQRMNLFFDAVNAAKQGQNNQTGGGKDEKVRTQLFHCTYNDDVKFVIEKAVKQILHVYPHFQTEILTFTQHGQQKRYLELKGIIQIEVRGRTCKVDYNMMLPNGFPKKSPYVRIVNRNAEYNVDQFYNGCQSPNDPKSYILNDKLTEIKQWEPSKSLVNVIIESQDMMRNHFPFTKPKSQNSSYGGSTGSSGFTNPNNNSSWGNNSPWQNTGNQNQNSNNQWNNYGANQNQGSGWGNNNNYNSGWGNNQQGNQQGWGNQNQNQGYNGMSSSKQPPIPFNGQSNTSIGDAIAKGQKYIGQNKRVLDSLKLQHAKALDTIQQLEIVKCSLQSEESYLRGQNYDMTKFLQDNENGSTESLSNVIQPGDNISAQILETVTSIKAREETVIFLEMKFTEGNMTFEEFLKFARKMEEEKFDDKVLLSKCMSAVKNSA